MHLRSVASPGSPVPAPRVLTFGHSGWLWRNSYLLYDRETDSLWHHLTGRAMSGPLRGTALRRLPTVVTTWAAWRSEHPATRVLPRPPAGPRGEPTDEDGYARRNARRSFGYGIDVAGAQGASVASGETSETSRLYPLESLPADGVVEEEVGGVPVVVVLDAEGGAVHAYDRRAGGRVLSFTRDSAGSPLRPVLRERGGSGAWSLRSGTPLAPGLPSLRRLLGSTWEVVAWRAQHPAGSSFGAAAVPASPPR